jgi:hypothetical protein
VYLTEPCLIPTFPEEILFTLSKHCQSDYHLPIQYYTAVSPQISSTKVLDSFFACVCQASITEGYFFTKSHPTATRRHLFEQLLAFVHGSSSGETQSQRGIELVNLPFDREETEWFEEFLLRGSGKGLFGAKDTVIVRYIAEGRSEDAEKLSREVKERKIDGVNWTSLTQGL